jgi:hypothetical protein
MSVDDAIEPGLQVSLVPPQFVDQVWNECVPHLRHAINMSAGRYNMHALYDKLISGEFHMWIVFDHNRKIIGVNTTTFHHYPTGERSVWGQFLGGERLAEWQDQMCDIIARWAKDNKCSFIEFTGRPGWGRLLSRNGYAEEYRTYRKDLAHGQW